jgi:signal transduction histidine kinase/CheY-like chemotaxis protein
MKISYRILVINFAIVVLILASSAIAFYSVVYNVLSSQQSKYLLNAANELIYAYRNSLLKVDDEFNALTKKNPQDIFNLNVNTFNNVDFAFEVENKNNGTIIKKIFNQNVLGAKNTTTLQDFLNNNPFSYLKKVNLSDGRIIYYGKVLNNEFLNSLSKKINADLAIVSNGIPTIISNEAVNQLYSFALSQAAKSLSTQNNFDLFKDKSSSSDILATKYNPTQDFEQGSKFQFIIFTALNEAGDLRNSLKYILIIIGSAGVVLSLILSLVFTDKIRKQIRQLSLATSVTKEGNFQNKIAVQSNDELGKLAIAFNTMLDELQKKEKAKNEYSDFITMLNQKPTLSEVSDAALKKIISTCGFTVGALYLVENNKIELLSSYGLEVEHSKVYSGLFKSLIDNNETIEINSQETLPVVSAGIVGLKIRYMMFVPIFYNGRAISILELGSFDKPSDEVRDYLSKIKEQLAIGLTNASAFVQLENLVSELKQLNEEYQKQNIQIRKQNETLVDLHKKLKEKADELEIQKRKAEEATKLKSQFLASMSHELRTPMNSVLGLTELILEDKSLNEKNRERIEVVLKSGRRLMNLINDILDLSKIEAGKMNVHNEEIIIEDLISEAESAIIPLIEKKDLSFKVVCKTNTRAVIKTDRGKVTQILINLLGNAVKFTENGLVELRVSSDEKKFLQFDVVDTGIGISEEFQKIIFDEFRQIDGTTTRKYSGTGLGLAICKKLADMLNGSISVKSKSGKGSTFTLSIPLNYIGIRESDKKPKINTTALIKNRKNPILILTDDSEVKNTVEQCLISNGYNVEFAKDGTEGFQKALMLQPFAIVLDTMLPQKDGWTVLEELKQEPLMRNIPVIVISNIGDRNLGFDFGAFEYLVKPIFPEQLFDTVKRLENLIKKKIEKIVIVDDDELQFEKFKNAFKNENLRIDYIKNSEIAFSKILEIQPDMVIVGLVMPNIDGVALSYKLKSNSETRHIPIIINTDKMLSDEERKALSNVADEVAVKDEKNPHNILNVFKEHLDLHSTKTTETNFVNNTFNIQNVPKEEENKIKQGSVLIVDDDPDSLYTLNEIVQACECNTLLAKSGAECLKILEQKIPDLILLDIMMPEMDGFQTFNRIKQNAKLSGVPIFAITAKAMLEDKQVILKYGFDDYIAKPVNTGVLAFKIERLFSKLKLT